MSDYVGMKVLHLDIETCPSLAYVWNLFKENITIDRLVVPGYTLCFAAKWEHEDEVMFHGLFSQSMEGMLASLWELLDEADVVVHYNGKKFDMPTINREFLKYGMGPPSPYQQIDLYQVVRSTFKFASNKLDFVSRELGIGAKVQHKGMQLWTDCMKALEYSWDEEVPLHLWEAWEEMEEYNRQDVKLLPELYRKLQPWIRNHPNWALWLEPGDSPVCPNCGSTDLRFKSYKRTTTMKYKQYHCQECGAYPRERFTEKEDRGRRDVLRT